MNHLVYETLNGINNIDFNSKIQQFNNTEAIRRLDKAIDLVFDKKEEKEYDERINYLRDSNNAIKLSISIIEKQIPYLLREIQKLQSLSKQLNSKKCLNPKRFNFFEIK
jgi:hypothetical protein